jgi:hypothetical protein
MPDQRAPEADRRTGPTQVSTPRARAGVTGHNVRSVLGFGLIAVIIAFVILYISFFHQPASFWVAAYSWPPAVRPSTTPIRKRTSLARPLRPISLHANATNHPLRPTKRVSESKAQLDEAMVRDCMKAKG